MDRNFSIDDVEKRLVCCLTGMQMAGPERETNEGTTEKCNAHIDER